MANQAYPYSIADDTANGLLAEDALTKSIQESAIVTALDGINTDDDDLSVVFKDILSSGDETTLDGLIAAHDGAPISEPIMPTDTDGVPLSRTKITKTGWHFQAQTVEFVTSKLDSLYNHDMAGTDLGYATIKYYDDNDDEITSPTQQNLDDDCVKTVIDWEPTHDIEIIGGTLYQSTVPTHDVRVWIIAVPDVSAMYGGSIPFAEGGLNLKHMGTGAIMDLDGKTPKLMKYDATYHTNKFRIVAKHTAGDQCPLMIVFKIFEA